MDQQNTTDEIGLFEAVYSARAMRCLKPDPIPPQLIARILEAATQAPNAGNAQNWLFMVVRDEQQRRRIGAIYRSVSQWVGKRYEHQRRPDHISQEQHDRLMKSGMHLYEHMAEAPVLLIPCLRLEPLDLPADVPASVAAAMQGARPWTAGASIYPAVQNTIAEDEIKAVLNLPANVRTFALMPIGYPVGKFGPVKRRPIDEVAMLDRYGSAFTTS